MIKRFEGFTGGGSGINLFGVPELTASLTPVTILGKELPFNDWLYYLTWTTALVGYVLAWLLLRGRTGLALRAVRDSETAAQSSGVSLPKYKTLAFGVSAAYAGVAGSLFAIATTFVNPDTFPIALSILLLVGVVVGGLGSLVGLIAGAVFIQFLPIWSQEISKSPGAPAIVSGRRPDRADVRAADGCRRAWSRVSDSLHVAATIARSLPAVTARHGLSNQGALTTMIRKLALALTALAIDVRARRRPPRSRARRALTADPGVTANSILLGTTSPLTGSASAYASVARGADAYFKYVNSKGGVNGRTITEHDRRRRVQPGQHGPGDAQARRAGQGLRDLQRARHRAQRRDARRT